MGPPALRAVAERLVAEGLVPHGAAAHWGAARPPVRTDAVSPYVRAFSGAAAWLATLFFYGSLACGGGLEKELWIPVGLAACVAATILRRAVPGVFAEQAALSAALTGEVLVIVRLADWSGSAGLTSGGTILLEGALLLLFPDAYHRAISVAAASLAAVVLAGSLEVPRLGEGAVVALGVATGLAWLARPGLGGGRREGILEACRYGLVGALCTSLLASFPDVAFDHRAPWWFRPGAVTTGGLAIALLALVLRVLREIGVTPLSRAGIGALGGTAAVALLTLRAPGVVAGAGLLALALRAGSRPLLGAGVLFLFVFGSAFYYWMEASLFDKSISLLGSGAVLLAAWVLLVRGGEPSTNPGGAP